MSGFTEEERNFVRRMIANLDAHADWLLFVAFGKKTLEKDPAFLVELVIQESKRKCGGDVHPDTVTQIINNLGFKLELKSPHLGTENFA